MYVHVQYCMYMYRAKIKPFQFVFFPSYSNLAPWVILVHGVSASSSILDLCHGAAPRVFVS